MTLTRSSVLHDWTSRRETMPIVGGKPVHSRASAARWVDQNGILQSSIVNTPRGNIWTDLGDGRGRGKVMRLEQSRTNVVAPSEDFASWTNGGATVTPGAVIGPDGLLSGTKLLGPVGGTSNVTIGITFAGDGEKAVSIFLSAGTATRTTIGLRDVTAATWRHLIDVNWNAGVPALANNTGAGTLYPIEALGGGWYRISFSATGVVAANTNTIFLYPSNTGVANLYVFAFGAQAENATAPSSYVKTVGSGATRAADSFYWDFTPAPQAMMAYLRVVARGTTTAPVVGSPRFFQIGSVTDGPAAFLVYSDGTFITVYHRNAASATVSASVAACVYGDVLEVAALLLGTGAVRGIVSINGAAVLDSGASGALALDAAWDDTKLMLNSIGANNVGAADFADLRIVKYADVVAVTAQGIMDELRAFELSDNGEVL